MPKYILAKGTLPKLTPNQIAAAKTLLWDHEKEFHDHDLSERQTWYIVNATFRARLDGEIISFLEAQRMIDRFLPEQKRLLVSKDNIDAFLKIIAEKIEADKKDPLAVPPDFDLGLRFYVGKDANDLHRAIIVPVSGPRPAPGNPRRHEFELEKTLFVNAETPFFALVPSLLDTGGNGTIEDITVAGQIIKTKDESAVEMVYFLLGPLRFILGKLNGRYSKMLITFARTTAKKLTVVLMFLDDAGDPVVFDDDVEAVNKITGVCFDQGDLMPPPPVSDRSI